MAITYKEKNNNTVSVYLGKKLVGEIHRVDGGFQYFPKGHSDGGDIFDTLDGVKQSLEV